MKINDIKKKFRKDKYIVITDFNQKELETLEQATIEIFDTKKSTKDDGYTDCSWMIVAFIDEKNKVVYLSEHHDGLMIENIKGLHLHYCFKHGGVSMKVYNARITHRGGDFMVDCNNTANGGLR